MTHLPTLAEQAEGFASELTATVFAVVGIACGPFEAEAVGRAFWVRQNPATGVPLRLPGEQATLKVLYTCEQDSTGRHLRVVKSQFALYYGAVAQGAPIFRYDYDRQVAHGLPRSHLQIREAGDSSDLGALLAIPGESSRRARQRMKDADRGRVLRQDDFHFPLGGDRFRPALEDVLQVLIVELGIEPATPDWRQVLEDGRQGWREKQLRAAVRDNPQAAAEALVSELGYTVSPPSDGHPPPNTDQLRRL